MTLYTAIDHKRFCARRKELGLSQRDFAKSLKLTRSAVCRSERNPGSVGEDRFNLYVKALQVSPEWLRGDEDAVPPAPFAKDETADVGVTPEVEAKSETKPVAVVERPLRVTKSKSVKSPKKVVKVTAKAKAKPAPKAKPSPKAKPAKGEFDDVLSVLQEERRKGIIESHQRVESIRSLLAHFSASLTECKSYTLIALDDYERALESDVVSQIRSRITGSNPSTASDESVHMVFEQIGVMESLAVKAFRDLKDLLGPLPPRPVKTAPVVIAPTNDAPVASERPSYTPPVTEPKGESKIVTEPAPEGMPNPVKVRKFLLIGGSYPAHPDAIRNVRKVMNVDIECIPTPKGNVKGAEDAANRIRSGTVDGVVLMGGYVSHSISNKIRLAVETTETPIGYSHGNTYAQILKAVKGALNPGRP